MKHLLKLLDLTGEEILDILNLADQLKYETKHGIEHPALKGKCLGMIFEKSSTRTRVSFEVGINQLGGYAVVLGAEGSQIGRGEPVQDTARVLSRYVDGIMIRTFGQDEVEALAQYGSVPVINGLTDFCHPCQVLADLMTIREGQGQLRGAETVLHRRRQQHDELPDRRGAEDRHGSGRGLSGGLPPAPGDPGVRRGGTGRSSPSPTTPRPPRKDADVVITDVWTSMGQEEERKAREAAFQGYCVDEALMAVAKPDAMVQHCLPAHRGEEISADVFEANANYIFEEAENRLHAQKAVLVKTMGAAQEQ